DGTGRAGLRLHFADLDGGTEDVLLTLGGPLIDVVGHGAGGRDGVDTRHFGKRVGHIGRSVVTVHCNEFSGQVFDLLLSLRTPIGAKTYFTLTFYHRLRLL